jgi:hypothetical protein
MQKTIFVLIQHSGIYIFLNILIIFLFACGKVIETIIVVYLDMA